MKPVVRLRLLAHRAVCGFVWLLSEMAGLLGARVAARPTNGPSLCIEAGVKGWSLIEYQEIWESAAEYFGVERVVRHVVANRAHYSREARAVIRYQRPEFYWVDPRSGPQEPLRAVLQSASLAVTLAWYGVTPIAWLADAPNRVWRLQSELVTARSGVCLTFVHPVVGGIHFAHTRVLGPCLFPLSVRTLRRLRDERAPKNVGGVPVVSFVGSLYEPRRTRLLELRARLAVSGVDLRLIAPGLTGKRLSNEEYWAELLDADILITTADHVSSSGHDEVQEPHFVFRFTEALAAGAALVAPTVKGSEKFFHPERDYLPFSSSDEARDRVLELFNDPVLRASIAERGNQSVAEMVESGRFWRDALEAATIA